MTYTGLCNRQAPFSDLLDVEVGVEDEVIAEGVDDGDGSAVLKRRWRRSRRLRKMPRTKAAIWHPSQWISCLIRVLIFINLTEGSHQRDGIECIFLRDRDLCTGSEASTAG